MCNSNQLSAVQSCAHEQTCLPFSNEVIVLLIILLTVIEYKYMHVQTRHFANLMNDFIQFIVSLSSNNENIVYVGLFTYL